MSGIFLGPLKPQDLPEILAQPVASKVGKAHFVASGSHGLRLLLRSLNLKKGALVAIPALICPMVVEGIVAEKLTPLFIDIDPENFFMRCNPEQLKKLKPDAIILPHLYGIANPDTELFRDFSTENRIPLIHDAAQSYGLEYKGRSIVEYDQGGVISFGQGKATTAATGALVTGVSEAVIEEENLNSIRRFDPASRNLMRVRMGLKSSPWMERFRFYGFRASRIQIKAAIYVMAVFAEQEKKRRENWNFLQENLGPELYGASPERSSYYKFILHKVRPWSPPPELAAIPHRQVVKYPASMDTPIYNDWDGYLYELSTERSLKEW
ncbi:MAG: DegT/DnrJ/EryC1/StrS family aminotransferase [Magnetococcales bacterium]|nr:DegT/DnrJ/EryC1/StrS family aminotransferase [Magnetococcales bacterium]